MEVDIRRFLFVVLTIGIALGLIEFSLTLVATMSPRAREVLGPPVPLTPLVSPTVPDDRLGVRPNPQHPDHDENGFRNPSVPITANVVALGDSQTYGTNVRAIDAWPRRLENLTGKTVYNMAYGGYGPIHSLILMQEATALDPDVVVVTIYSGNDLYDAFAAAYYDAQFPELKSSDPNTMESIRLFEESSSIEEDVSRMFRMGVGDRPSSRRLSIRRLFSEYSKSYGLLRRIRYERKLGFTRDPWDDAVEFARSNPEYTEVFDDGVFRTIFTPQYRLSALNMEDPRIAEGFRMSLEAIHQIHEDLIGNEVRLIVLLIPTKEYVFLGRVRSPSPSYARLTENEEAVWRLTKRFLDRYNIEYVDALEALQASLSAGIQPYPVNHDGHPNPHGHLALAESVQKRMAFP